MAFSCRVARIGASTADYHTAQVEEVAAMTDVLTEQCDVLTDFDYLQARIGAVPWAACRRNLFPLLTLPAPRRPGNIERDSRPWRTVP
jgi:hypothetical protein